MNELSNLEKAARIIGNSLFLFGAGATRDAGCKTSREMLGDISNMDLSRPEKEAIDFLLSALDYHASWKNLKETKSHSNSNRHQANIEDLVMLIRRIVNKDSYLPYPITGSWADKINFLEIDWKMEQFDSNSPEQFKSLFQTLEQKFTERLYRWLNMGRESTNYLCAISDYLKKSDSNSPKLEFFTLNYDLVFEKHFNKNDDTLLDTGFAQGYFHGFGKEDTSNPQFRINYYKLHGSLNWIRAETGRIRESFNYTQKDDRINIRIETEEQEISEFLLHPPTHPHIIFGHGGKFLTVDPFLTLLYHFKYKLESNEIFFVIGYSFFDPYINNMLLEGLSKESRQLNKMIVVNPQFAKKEFLRGNEKEEDISDGEWKNRFVDYIQNVQLSPYLSDLPSFNVNEISPELIEIIPEKAELYFSQLFSEEGKGLADIYNQQNIIENSIVWD